MAPGISVSLHLFVQTILSQELSEVSPNIIHDRPRINPSDLSSHLTDQFHILPFLFDFNDNLTLTTHFVAVFNPHQSLPI